MKKKQLKVALESQDAENRSLHVRLEAKRLRILELKTESREDIAGLIRQIQLADKEIKERDVEIAKLKTELMDMATERNCYYTKAAELKALSNERWEPVGDSIIHCASDFRDVLTITQDSQRIVFRVDSHDAEFPFNLGEYRVCRKVEAVKDEVNA